MYIELSLLLLLTGGAFFLGLFFLPITIVYLIIKAKIE